MNKIVAFFCGFLMLFNLILSAQSIKKGVKALKKGDFDRAKEVFDEVVTKNKDQKDVIKANYGLSQLYINKDYPSANAQQAFKYINDAIEGHKKLEEDDVKDLEEDEISYNSLFKQKLFIENELNAIKLAAEKEDEKNSIENTLNSLPDAQQIKDLEKRKVQVEFNKAAMSKSEEALNQFIAKYPNASQIPDAITLRNSIAIENAKAVNTFEAFQHFIDMYPEAEQINEAVLLRNQLAYISMLEKSKEMQNLALEKNRIELEHSRNQKILFAIGSFLLLMLVGVSFFAYTKTRKNNKLLSEQKKEIENKNNVLEVANTEIKLQKNLLLQRNSEITDSINYAKKIQDAILKVNGVKKRILPDSFILFKPKDIVSGDFYWMTEQQNKILLIAADCTGHGVPGSFMSLICTSILNHVVKEKGITETNEIFDEVRKGIVELLNQEGKPGEHKDGMDAALCAFDKNNNVLSFSGANNPIYVVRKSNSPLQKVTGEIIAEDIKNEQYSLFQLKPDKQPIGYFRGNEIPFSQQNLKLEKGDSVYMFSDGYADQFGGLLGKKFKYLQLKNLLLSIQHEKLDAQKSILDKTIHSWMGELEQIDDICVIGFKV